MAGYMDAPGMQGMTLQQQQDTVRQLQLRAAARRAQEQQAAEQAQQQNLGASNGLASPVVAPVVAHSVYNNIIGRGAQATGGATTAVGSTSALGRETAAQIGTSAANYLTGSQGAATVGQGASAGAQAVGQSAPSYVNGATAAPAAATSAGTPGFAIGTPSYAGYLGGIAEGYNAYRTLGNDNMTGKEQASRAQQQGALAVANVYTGGLASLAENFLRGNKTTGKILSKIDKFDQKTNPVTIIGGKFLNGKGKDQMGRDSYRDILQKAGVYDKDYNLTLSDGTKVNMGLDGSLDNYNVDFSEPGIDKIVALVAPFATLVNGGDEKKSSDLAGELTNAIKNSKDPALEAARLFEQVGMSKAQALEAIKQLNVDEQTKAVYTNTVNSLNIRDPKGTPTAGTGGSTTININVPPAQQVPTQKRGVDTGLLDRLLAKSTEPVQYPRNRADPSAPRYKNTMNDILGI